MGIGGRDAAAGLRTASRLGFDIDEEPYGSDFDSLSGEDASPSGKTTSPDPQIRQQGSPDGRSLQQSSPDGRSSIRSSSYVPVSDPGDSSNSFHPEVCEAEDTVASSLDEVGLGKGEWRQLLAEAEAILHPESQEEVVEEAKMLRDSVYRVLGGTARVEEALKFLRNRRPLGETVEADELMLQVELGDLLGDDGLQALPFLERLVELEGAGTTTKFASGVLRLVARQDSDDN